MNLEINPDYIRTYMKEIQDTVDEIRKPQRGSKWVTELNRGIWLDSIKLKSQFVINYMDRIEQEHNQALNQLEKDMDIFREAADFKGEICNSSS